tara:strand:+ start:4696 stop:5214 length:519 start_codon:yes stop_codon:yes gene_type:complete
MSVDISNYFQEGNIEETENSSGGSLAEGYYDLGYAGCEEVEGKNEKTGPEGWSGFKVMFELETENGKLINLDKSFIMKYAGQADHWVCETAKNDFALMMKAFGVSQAKDLDQALAGKYVHCHCNKNENGYLQINSQKGKNWQAVEGKSEEATSAPAPTSEEKDTLEDESIPF